MKWPKLGKKKRGRKVRAPKLKGPSTVNIIVA